MYCKECGFKNGKEAVFCRQCGKKLVEIDERSERRSVLPVIGGVFLIIIMFGILFFSVFKFVKAPKEEISENRIDSKVQEEVQKETPDESLDEEDVDIVVVFQEYIEDISYEKNYFQCIFAYIDEDDIPELIMDNSGDGRDMRLLCYKDGQVFESGIWTDGDILYREKENEIIVDSEYNLADERGTIFEVAHIEDGEYYVDKSLQEIVSIDVNGNETSSDITINNHTVSKEDFDHEVEQYRGQDGLESLSPIYGNLFDAYDHL